MTQSADWVLAKMAKVMEGVANSTDPLQPYVQCCAAHINCQVLIIARAHHLFTHGREHPLIYPAPRAPETKDQPLLALPLKRAWPGPHVC